MGSYTSVEKTGDEAVPQKTDHVPPSDCVVNAEKVKSIRGAIPISGRYCTARPLHADYILMNKVVGSGMSGPVQLAAARADGRRYAVKSFKKNGLSLRRRKELQSEVEIYLSLDHPHVARLEMVYEADDDLHMVMEFMEGGELYERLSERKRYTEQAAATTTYQMFLAVAYLHAHGVVHRDLKLENFLYEKKGTDHIKLIDFGFAKFWDRSKKMEQACGSVHYVAPEVLAHAYTEKVDVWSLGVIVYMLLTGSPPFHGSDDEVLKKIKCGKPHLSSRFNALSTVAKDFVMNLLVVDPTTRFSCEQALAHRFVQGRETGATEIDLAILKEFRRFAHASHFRRAVYTMMAWSLTADHREELRQQFLLLDTENTGTIKHSKVKELLLANFKIDSEEAEALFASLDTDNDDELAYSEFLAAVMQDRIRLHEDVLRRTFSRFDHDQSGYITVKDLQQVLGDTFEGEDVADLLREADADRDGAVSYDEFLRYFQSAEDEEEVVQEPRTAAGVGDAHFENGAPKLPLGQPPNRRSSRRRARTEKLSEVLERLLPEHADCDSPTVGGCKTPTLREKARGVFGRARSEPSSVPTAPRALLVR
eukprot:TRINITY_DN13585_c0_g1_i2.p1 TRINITY_DN13585_c0_g1~~TRINITY_DN13585_c0_g1_i2.p1  ORF type:complete len:593 (+),score=139.16 TRINITY_DN13585_c0_g1_i2:83-1861(+)